MLKKLSEFVVNKRIFILVVMLILAVVGLVCSLFVTVNEDLTKYLPDDSNMKQGMDIMADAFPEMAMSNTIRVMFDDLKEEDKPQIIEKMSAIEHVDSVDHVYGSEEYNKDNHTLFVINMSCDYRSDEEAAIENQLETQFAQYNMVYQNDDTAMPDIPIMVIVVVMIIILVILFTMCGSWLEPFLFLIAIGIAVVINNGTNIILGTVSSVTNSMSAMLQLVLSMDYSVIVMNRYRQERALEPDKNKAMKKALVNAFSSVTSSSFTTVVGLLMLIFMSFKIGADLGFVLAKGVFISMVCVLTVLPSLILLCDKGIEKTAKKELHIPMNWAANYSHKWRYVLTGVFVVLFIGAYILQTKAGIDYILVKNDAVADVFPKTNMVVMVYENKDEDKLDNLLNDFDENKNVTSTMGYGTIFAKPYTSADLVNVIGEMGGDLPLNSSMLDMIYYTYYSDSQELGTMTAGEFLSFISDTVAKDDSFSAYISDDMAGYMDMIGNFSDAESLQKPMNADELAALFGMKSEDIKGLFLLYQIENKTKPTESMTMATFADFVVNDVAKDPTYGAMFDEETLGQLSQLTTFTDAKKMTTPYSYKEIATLIGMDEETTKLLFVYYYALSGEYEPGTMSVSELLSFVQSDIMSNPMFSDYMGKGIFKQLGGNGENSLVGRLKSLGKLMKNDQMTYTEMAQVLDMDSSLLKILYTYYYCDGEIENWTASMHSLINFLVDNKDTIGSMMDSSQMDGLVTAQAIINGTVNKTSYTADEISALTGMTEEQAQQLYLLYTSKYGDTSDWKLSIKDFIDFIISNVLTNEDYASMIDAESREMLSSAKIMIDAVIENKSYTAEELSALFQGFSEELDVATVEMMYLFAQSVRDADPDWKMSLEGLFNYIVNDVINDPRFASFIDDSMKASLTDGQAMFDDGKKQLVGEKYSRLILYTKYSGESEETTEFLKSIEEYAKNNFDGQLYLIGESVMAYEMQQIFDKELLFITMLTAFAIFLIVAFTFKSVIIPLILVLLVQCGVYITVTVTGITSGGMFYLALLIVECILMGATIDYGILFTNYYRENRRKFDKKEALKKAYEGSIHTILTSGLILVLVTAVVGKMFEDATVSAIVRTLSIGSFCAILLILFILPGVLAACDRMIIKKKDRSENIE